MRSAVPLILAGCMLVMAVRAQAGADPGRRDFTWTMESLTNDPGLNTAWWIWSDKDMLADPNRTSPLRLTKTIQLDDAVKDAWVRISAQGKYTLFINDKPVGEDTNVWTIEWYDLKPFLRQGQNRFRVDAKSDTSWAGLFVSGRIDETNGGHIDVLSDGSWTAVVMDEAFQTPQGDPKPAGEVVQGINGGFWNNCGRIFEFPPEYYQLNLGVESPGIAWARPYAGPRLRVAAIHPRVKQRDTVELIQRSAMDVRLFPAEIYEFNHQYVRAPFFPHEKGRFYEDAASNIVAAFQTPADVVIFGGVSADEVDGKSLFYDVAAQKLQAFVQNGGGLVYVDGAIPPKLVPTGKKDAKGKELIDKDASYERELTANAISNAPEFLAQGTPFAALPGFYLTEKDVPRGFQKAATIYQYGKGRIVRLNGNIGGTYGLFVDRPGDNNDLHYQIYLSFAIKCILWAAGREPAVQFANFPADVHTEQGHPVALAFDLSGAPAGCELLVSVRSPERNAVLPPQPLFLQGQERGAAVLQPLCRQKQAVKSGAIRLELPVLPAGHYFVDVQALDHGKKANWAVASLVVTSKLDLATCRLSKEYIDVADSKSDSLQATIRLTEPAPADATVHFDVIDNYDRVTVEKDLVVPAGQQAVDAEFSFETFATTLGNIRAELRVKGAPVAIRLTPFTAVRRDWDRYMFTGWFSRSDSHNGNVYLRMLGEQGLDAPRCSGISLDWLNAVDMVGCPGYPAFPRYGAEQIEQADLLKSYGEQARKGTEPQLRFDPMAFNTGDEFTYRGGEENPSRVLAYRKHLEQKYGAIAKLNQTWGSSYTNFGEIFPSLPAAQCKGLLAKGAFYPRETFDAEAATSRNYSRLIDQWLDNYRAYNETARASLHAIKSVLPTARIGCDCPMWPDAFSGHDWYSFLQEFDYFAPYGRCGEIIPEREARSYFHPEKGQFIGLTYGGYLYMAFNRKEELNDVDWQWWRIWSGLFQGFTSLWWYNFSPGADEGNVAPGFQPYPTLQKPAEAIGRFRNGIYDLLNPRKVRRDYGPIAIQDSIVSRLAVAFAPEDFSGGGLGHNMDTHLLLRILEEQAGYNFTFVADPQLTQGELQKYKVLMMPLSLAVGAKEAAAMRQFAERGGILIADIRPGVFNGSGKWDDSQVVPNLFGLSFKQSLSRKMVAGDLQGELFGKKISIPAGQPFPADPAVELMGAKALCTVEGIPLVTCNQVGKGYAICLNIPFNYYREYMLDSHYAYFGDATHNRMIKTILTSLFDALDVKAPLKVDMAGGGEWPYWMDVAYFPDGRAQYIGVTKGRKTDNEASYEVTVQPKAKGHVYDVLAGKYLGELDAIPMTVNRVDVKLFAVLPYKMEGVEVKLDDAAIHRGDILKGHVRIRCDGSPVRHVINVRAVRPDGQRPLYLVRNLTTVEGGVLRRGGAAEFALPFAWNEPAGTWKLEFTDVATGTRATVDVTVK